MKKIFNMMNEKKRGGGPKIVAIGGGTGLSNMLRGLKEFSKNITAVVTVTDDGGGSGVLRQDLGILPPGDIRNCILALAQMEPIMEELLQYRFPEGILKGQCFGNLFLAAMDGISLNFAEAVKKVSDVLAVTGRVLPITLSHVSLVAELENGSILKGETTIGQRRCAQGETIKRLKLEPTWVNPLEEVIDAIKKSDVILLGPGSLYTSVIPNLLVNGVCDAIKQSDAMKIYICNIMTQPGETEWSSVSDHIKAIERHSYRGIVEYCFVNTAPFSEELRLKYEKEGSFQVEFDDRNLWLMGIKCLKGNFLSIENRFLRHDAYRISQEIMKLLKP
jgi:uncharacterized cofD-like protein